jgi:UDP-N-acetylmuramoylalanine--D-glutamate ligase
MELKGRKVTVVGLGNSGLNAAILLDDIGARVFATDSQDTPAARSAAEALKKRKIEIETGGHSEEFFRGSELVVLSPGVENSSPAVILAGRLKIPIIGEMELGYLFCKGRIIAVTGTNGKSTITTLIGRMLEDGGRDVVACGNIGNSLCGEISRIKNDTWVSLEVSSFQLERIEKFKPRIALILNITDDHMDRYAAFTDYFNQKLKVFRNQDEEDCLILNYDAENLRALKGVARSKTLFYSRTRRASGAYVKDGKITVVSGTGSETEVCGLVDIRLKGLHNVENVLASSLTAIIAGVEPSSVRNTIMNFKGLAHRFETVDVIDGVEYIDDSKGTTVDSTCRALESCRKPVILIAGGRDKNSDYSVMNDIVKDKVRALVLIGEARQAIKKVLGRFVSTYEAKDMPEAVETARRISDKDQIVLLSPMCSSFDMFSSYKERGEAFRQAVVCLREKSEIRARGLRAQSAGSAREK